ncbi:hypothetical protein Taro_019203 [Colocasia esculenta]|uniref:Retrotransposon gag domain-containing protein n=1 Tax=Colocasia esculenta TaxID=4460 RepID=A0A843UTB5_COLES|nr:hypothetical protein [Colocasia esculenta]
MFLAIYHDKEQTEVKEEASPTSSWSHLHPRTRRRAIMELLGTAQGELLRPFRSVWIRSVFLHRQKLGVNALDAEIPNPWLREVGVAERRPVRTSRDVTSGRSSRPRHRKVLYFPHRRLWIMEYSCKVWCKPCRRRLILRQHSRHSWRLSGVLQERADVWWASLRRTRFEDGAIDVAWDEFVRLFRAKFVPEHIQDRIEQEFLSLTQGSMTVLEYEARFSELSKYAPHIVTDERRKTKKFVMGLKPSLRTRLVAFDHRTLDEALSAACREEGEMEQYLEEKKASQKRPAATFQR